MATLGISTNTRLLGLAIIHQKRLVAYSTRLHKSSWSARKANSIITSLEPCVRRYCIKRVVLSIPREYHQTKAFKILLSAIRKHFAEAGIPVLDYPTESIYLFCPPQHKKIKRVAMIGLTERHPELRYCLNKELRNKNKYYLKLFEAVAVATLQEEKK